MSFYKIGGWLVLIVLWIITYLASFNSFSYASFVLYGDAFLIPIVTTVVIVLLSSILYLTWESWVIYAEMFVYSFLPTQEDDEDEDDEDIIDDSL